jgi:F420-dependent oxidoreductase-like protein
MRVGLQLPSYSWPDGPAAIPGTLASLATLAEDCGFASLWVMDHLYQLPADTGWGGPDEPMLEAYSTLGYLAHTTSRIALGPMVVGVHFRPAAVVLKAATTLDVLSGGRSYFAVGAGWYQREADGLGIPFPPRRERFERLEDLLAFATQAWSEGEVRPFRGRHLEVPEPIVNPRPVARPRPRIMVGGNGERRTLRLVAEYADACNILVPDPGESRRKLEVLRRHCDAVGRSYEAIEKTSLVEVDLRAGRGTAADAIRRLREQREEGIEHVIVNFPDAHERYPLEVFGREVIPAVAGA